MFFSKRVLATTLMLFTFAQSLYADTEAPKFDVNKTLFPYKSHFMTLENGAKIHYIDEGNGQVLLLLHGNPTWSFLYRKIIAGLKDDFRLIAPDYPGFGLSTAPDSYGFTAQEHADTINAFVKKLDLKDITVMVQDWGGPIGFDLAIQQPERIKGFIIGNTWAWPLERTGHKVFSTVMGGWSGQFGAWCCNGIVKFFMTQGVANALDDNTMEMYEAPFNDRNERRQTHIFPAQLWDAKAFLANVHEKLLTLADKPALLVWGEKDFAFKKPERERFESIFTNHKTILLKNAGHFIQEDVPDEINQAIKNWYTTLGEDHE